jgi:hypothetical protein
MSIRPSLMIALAVAAVSACRAQAAPAPLVLERTIALKGVGGRIDHLAIDVAHHRLFVAELGNGSVEAIDLSRGVSLGRISGLKEPQGLAYLPARDELVVATGGDGSVRFYRAAGLTLTGSIALGADADNVRVDPGSGRVVVGYGSGALALIDPATRKVVGRLALPAHPEAFRLDGDRVLVNVPDARKIVVGRLPGGRIEAGWAVRYLWNFPMALDAASGALAVVYRAPPRLQVLDSGTGAVRMDRATCGDADDVFFDGRRARFYVVCGSGAIDVVETARPGPSTRVATRPGARTGLFAPELDRLLVAARAGACGEAAILVYRPQP